VGADTNGNAGGGGGVIVLIAHEFDNVVTSGGAPGGQNVWVDGGAQNAPAGKIAGGKGGDGFILKMQIP
jgi:hypothetical protein